jgi:hypothetical protein
LASALPLPQALKHSTFAYNPSFNFHIPTLPPPFFGRRQRRKWVSKAREVGQTRREVFLFFSFDKNTNGLTPQEVAPVEEPII